MSYFAAAAATNFAAAAASNITAAAATCFSAAAASHDASATVPLLWSGSNERACDLRSLL